MTALAHHEDRSPGSGARTPARAHLRTDAPALDLGGSWAFRLWPTADAGGTDGAELSRADADVTGWDSLPVPSHWVLHGEGRYGRPWYTNVQYPFPVDPPHVPDENPTGDHRRVFALPGAGPADGAEGAAWAGAERVLLRFDGVESTYRVWLNGTEVGVGRGSRLVQEFDVTSSVRPGENVLLVRVHQWSSASYLEDQDQWWLPGIFRDVTLLARPVGGLDDAWVRAGYDAATGAGRLDVELVAADAAYPVTLAVPELGLDVTWAAPQDVAPVDVGHVEPWSAEEPRLHDATLTSAGEVVGLRLGFRTVEVVGDQFLVNGRKVVFHGVNRHEVHAVRGRVFDAEHARADLVAMKRHNVNAIRTSHYPPHPRVLDLADELGFWVVDECDLETHGFELLGWAGNPSDDPAWEDAYLDRITRTVERDKNHPCVVVWSLGNEAGTGRNLALMSAWVHRRDPGRPVHYEGDHAGEYTDVYSRMYPTLEEVARIGGEQGPVMATTPAQARAVRRRPFLMCEYVHAMGNGPGAVEEYEALLDRYPRLHGGFVWEWRDHGLLTQAPDGTPFFAYGGDFGEPVHDGNFVMDGLVLSDDTPSPGLDQWAAVVAPVRLDLRDLTRPDGGVVVENRRHTASTADLVLRWVLERDGEAVAEGDLLLEPVPAGGTGRASVAAALREALGAVVPGAEHFVTVRAQLAADTAWAPAGHVVAQAQTDVTPPHSAPVPVRRPRGGVVLDDDRGTAAVGPAVLDTRTGRLVRLGDLAVDGPRLELWRAPTDNDRGRTPHAYELVDPSASGGAGEDAPSSAERWRARGLHRLVHRTVGVAVERGAQGEELVVRSRAGIATSALGADVTYRWSSAGTPGAARLTVEVVPSRGWDCTWPRVGIHLALPGTLDTAEWFGTGPGESYADSSAAVRVGRFTSSVADLSVPYSRPQETGHRPGLRELRLTGGTTGLGVRAVVEAPADERVGFSASRWTPQQLDAAAHPHELPPSDRVHLFLDAAQHGLGSRACGPDVLPQHALWPSAHRFVVDLTAL